MSPPGPSWYRFLRSAGMYPAPKVSCWFRFLRSPRKEILQRPHLLAFLIYLLGLIIVFCILGKTYKMEQDSIDRYTGVVGLGNAATRDATDLITLTGYPRQVDLDSQTVSIRWELGGCGTYSFGNQACGDCSRPMDLYVDGSLTPTFSYNISTSIFGTIIANSFNTDHQIGSSDQSAAPFDNHYVEVTISAIDKIANESALVRFSVNSSAQNFNVDLYTEGCATRLADNVDESLMDFCVALLSVKRSALAKAFTICLLIVNWALTSVSAWVAITVYFKGGKLPDAVLLFPLTLVVTIPALRNLYVGSPPFGIFIDVMGFFLQMIIVAICTVFLFCFGVRAIINKPAQHEPV